MSTQTGYTLYLIDQNGAALATVPYPTKAEAQTEYAKCARIFRSNSFAPEVKEVALYLGEDIELIATTAAPDHKNPYA